MLVLSRKPGEQLKIGDDVTIAIIAVKGNQVRIGINAPAHITVDRMEIAQRKEAERLGRIVTRP